MSYRRPGSPESDSTAAGTAATTVSVCPSRPAVMEWLTVLTVRTSSSAGTAGLKSGAVLTEAVFPYSSSVITLLSARTAVMSGSTVTAT